jgi:SpoVK/Ycf46/Vps4 family AAA+-type ATPase
LFRRGRWDAVFAVDLPTHEERAEIFAIHLKKRGRDPKNFDIGGLATATENFVGAEIESVVDEALYAAFSEDRGVTSEDLLEVCKQVVPISKMDKEAIEQFRDWMQARATPVSSGRKVIQKLGRAGGSRNLRISG